MEQAVSPYHKALRIAVVAVLILLVAAPLLPQNLAHRKGKQSSSGKVGGGARAILSFTPGMISTSAGTGVGGYSGDGGPATSAQFNTPMGMTQDVRGNLYVADVQNSVVRKLAADGTVTTFAGNGIPGYNGDGGPAISAQLAFPTAVALDAAGNLYIADFFNACVRKVDTTGTISTFATASGFLVRGVATDAAGNVYFSSSYEGVWKADSQGVTTKFAGNGSSGFGGDGGPALDAQTSGVAGLAVDGSGNVYFTEVFNSDVRKVDTNGIITTIAGNQQFGYAGDGGPATSAIFNTPTDVRIDVAGNLYIADSNNLRIRKVNAAGTISTIAGGNYGYAGDGGPALMAGFANPTAIALDGSANIFIADTYNNVIRKVRTDTTTIDFGTVSVGQTGGPNRVIVSNAGNAGLNVGNIVASSSFGVQTTCPSNAALTPGSDCSVDISFAPTVNGNVTGTVTLSDDAVGNPHLINLKGQGAPHPDKLVFATQFPSRPLNGNLGIVIVNATDVNNSLATGFAGIVAVQVQGPAGFTTYSTQSVATGGVTTFDLSLVVLNAAGSYTIRASSSGLASVQASFTVTGNPDFAISLSKESLPIATQSSGNIKVNVSPSNGFAGSIALTCSGLPASTTCSFVPASLQANGSNITLTSEMTISTGVLTAATLHPADGPVFMATAGVFSAGLLGLVFAPRARRNHTSQNKREKRIQLIVVAIILCGGLVGCGTLGGKTHATSAGSYTVTVKASSTGFSHNNTFVLVVQ